MKKPLIIGAVLSLLALPVWAGDMPRLLSTSGQGHIEVDADLAVISMTAEAFDLDQEKAKQAADRTIDKLIAAAKKMGVKERDIVASNLQINPRFNYDRNSNKPELAGYDARRPVTISLRDIDNVDKLFSAALEAGVTQMGSVELKNADSEKHQNAARDAAVADSKRKAEMLAKAYDAKLGPIHSIQYQSAAPMMPVMRERMVGAKMMMMDAMIEVPEGQYLHDKVTYHDSIEVVFELLVE